MTKALPQWEVCPSCGALVESLNDNTGWCANCSESLVPVVHSQVEAFLTRNADHIEHYLFKGYSVSQAIDNLRHELQQFKTCACCGAVIKRGAPNVIFCRKNKRCRKAVRRYEYLYTSKGHSKAEALAIVLEEFN